ncbi:MAG TPA: hypothetical protein VF920_12695, partial [Dongiaceae bacterium]
IELNAADGSCVLETCTHRPRQFLGKLLALKHNTVQRILDHLGVEASHAHAASFLDDNARPMPLCISQYYSNYDYLSTYFF